MIELSTDNGGSSSNYTGTTFYDLATTSVVISAAPFTGNYQPEQAVTNLACEDSNGIWQLNVC